MKRLTLYFVLPALLVINVTQASAQSEEEKAPRFSHKGLKATIGLGGSEMPSESNFEDGQTVSLNVGFGFSNHSTLWLGLVGAEYKNRAAGDAINEFGALELAYQYKFRPDSNLQPYGKVGLGGYLLKERDALTEIMGGGFSIALGLDHFVTRHIGFGLELFFKDIEFNKEREQLPEGDLTRDLNPHLNRDTRGLMVTLTIQ